MRIRALAWSARGRTPPGRLAEVTLEVDRVEAAGLVCPGLTVRSEQGEVLFDGGVPLARPHGGGGDGTAEHRREALAFGVLNTAHHLQRGLEVIARLRGRPLPPLLVRIGAHDRQRPDWAGGHYRLPALEYSSIPEETPPLPTGEIHLGGGGHAVDLGGEPYRHTASHDPAIVVHELGHHLTRHTADFRVNERRPALAQANLKTPLDEGTADYLAAVLLDTSDIYGWHRGHVPPELPRRRRLDAPWTMAQFVGGHLSDPHTDGTIWSAALWAARTEVIRRGIEAETLRWPGGARPRPGRADAAPTSRSTRHAGCGAASRSLAEAILEEDAAGGGRVAAIVEPVLAARGIEVGPRQRRAPRPRAPPRRQPVLARPA